MYNMTVFYTHYISMSVHYWQQITNTEVYIYTVQEQISIQLEEGKIIIIPLQ